VTRQLPLFEGRQPRGLMLSLSGTITEPGSQPVGPLSLGDEVYLLAVGRVVKVGHRYDRDGNLVRHHVVTVSEALPMADEEAGLDLARVLRRSVVEAIADSEGRVSLWSVDDETGEVGK